MNNAPATSQHSRLRGRVGCAAKPHEYRSERGRGFAALRDGVWGYRKSAAGAQRAPASTARAPS
jgi:hypothetical protein